MNTKIKDSHPLVSIIIRVKNEERWIGHCLDAITTQSIKNYEIVIKQIGTKLFKSAI